jgi:hypothetical protein
MELIAGSISEAAERNPFFAATLVKGFTKGNEKSQDFYFYRKRLIFK